MNHGGLSMGQPVCNHVRYANVYGSDGSINKSEKLIVYRLEEREARIVWNCEYSMSEVGHPRCFAVTLNASKYIKPCTGNVKDNETEELNRIVIAITKRGFCASFNQITGKLIERP